MADHLTWGWYVPAQWPFMEYQSQTNLDESGNGLSVDPAGYTEFTIRDADNDGIVYDEDFDGGPSRYYLDAVIGPTKTLYPQEIALYSNSSIVMNGQTITDIDMEVTLFTDGTYGVRILDWDIPAGHYSDVTAVTLGTWNGVEYSGISIAAVDEMFVCHVAGTLIDTLGGQKPIEQLKAGDLVRTLDHGYQPIRWIGRNTVVGVGAAAPVRIAAGTLENRFDCFVSPNHRVLVRGSVPELLFGEEEVLVTAKHLIDGTTITQTPRPLVEYVHFALDQHQVIFANGMPSETLLPGPQALELVSEIGRQELLQVFPELTSGWAAYGPAARLCLKKKEAEVLRWAMALERQLDMKVNGRLMPEYAYVD